MGCRSILLIGFGLAITSPLAPTVRGQEGRALTPLLEVLTSRAYVGQAIESHISVVAGERLPSVTIEKSEGVDVILLSGVEVQPRAASGIGERILIENNYRFPVRIVPRRPGRLTLPRIRVSEDQRSGVVPIQKLTVLSPPATGRTSAFLGGVGAMDAAVEVRPETVSLGESIEFRWKLNGPGSIGSSDPSTIPGLIRPRWQIEPLATESVVDPPSRTFRYRLKPDQPGVQTIGPILVSTLNPASGTYRTTVTKAITIRVIDVPRFDSATLPTIQSLTAATDRLRVIITLGLSGLMFSLFLVLFARFWHIRRTRTDVTRLSLELAKRIERAKGVLAVGEVTNSALGEFFQTVAGRAPGALTPEEARDLAVSFNMSSGVAEALIEVVQRLDEARYARNQTDLSEEPLRRRASLLLIQLGGELRKGRPREASDEAAK